MNIENIKIMSKTYGICLGESCELKAEIEPEDAVFSSFEWSSDNENVIKCTKSGVITGKSVGHATITCKAKVGKVYDTIKVYCVEPLPNHITSKTSYPVTYIYKTPSSVGSCDLNIDISFVFRIIFEAFKFIRYANLNAFGMGISFAGSFTAIGRQGNYCLVEYGNDNKRGFIKYTNLSKHIPECLYLSEKELILYSDGTSEGEGKLTANYDGEIEWSITNPSILSFDKNSGYITGKQPGKAIITAKANGMMQSCTVYVLFKWLKSWNTETTKEITVYSEPSILSDSGTIHGNTQLIVVADKGDNSNFCYVKYGSRSGFVSISDISQKATVSYYNSIDWRWPIADENIRHIYSPYGWRDTNPEKHLGIDITGGNDYLIEGEDVVSAFSGTVLFLHTDDGTKKGCGNCIGIMSDKIDPVTKKTMLHITCIWKNHQRINL